MSRRGTGWRIAGCLCAAVLLAGCFKKVSYETACILKPLSQRSSGDVIEPILGAQAFAYNVDTTLWTVASYDDALNGIITSKENPSERMTAPAAVSAPYESDGASGWLQLRLSRETQMVVVADPASRVYAYTQLKSAQNLPHLYVSVVFRTWKEGNSYKDGNWSFYNEFYTPPVYLDCYIRPEVQSTEGGAAAPVPSGKVNAYAYDADTTSWCIASYADALAGTITSKSDPTLKRTTPAFQAYKQSDSDLYKMTVSSPTLMVVVVDESDRMYAYTEKQVDLEGAEPTFDVLFRPWLGAWITLDDGWCFVDESKAPGDTGATGTTDATTRTAIRRER